MAKENLSRDERRKFDRGVISGNKNQSKPEFLDYDKLKSVISNQNTAKSGINMWFQQQKAQEEARLRKIEELKRNRNG